MERKRRRGVGYSLLILFMLFLGMCFEGIEADSSFAYIVSTGQADGVSGASSIQAPGNTDLSDQVYVKADCGSQENAAVFRHNAGKSADRSAKGGRISPCLTGEPELSLFSHTSDHQSDAGFRIIYSNTIIMDFIHQTDGKKA